jgi:hypothetical protein
MVRVPRANQSEEEEEEENNSGHPVVTGISNMTS